MKKRKKEKVTYTKKVVFIIVVNAVGWVWCSYVLAFLGRYAIAESLSQTAITAIIGSVVTYCIKSTTEHINEHGANFTAKQQETKNTKRDY